MHQKHLARAELPTIDQSMIGGAVGGEKGRALRVVEIRRQRRQLRRGDHGLIGIGAVAHLDDDAIADRDVGRRSVDFHDVASSLHARRERQLRLELILTGRHQNVWEVDAGRADRDPHLPGRERLRRERFQAQALGRTKLVADDRLRHQAALALRRASASRTSSRRSLPKYMSVLSMKMVGEPKPPRAITSSVLALSRSLIACWPMPARNVCGSTPTRLQTSVSTASCEMS